MSDLLLNRIEDVNERKETEKRIKRMIDTPEYNIEPKLTSFENTKHYDHIEVWEKIPFVSLCEHHLVSMFGKVYIGILISKNDKLIGLSKIPRIVEYFLNPSKPTLQERVTEEIADYITEKLNAENLIIVMSGIHFCCTGRGVKAHGTKFKTSAIRGRFLTQERLVNEFFKMINIE